MAAFPRAQVPSANDSANAALLNLARQSNPQMAAQLEGMSSEQIEQFGQQLVQSNPQFAAFVQLCQGSSLRQVARQYGFNL